VIGVVSPRSRSEATTCKTVAGGAYGAAAPVRMEVVSRTLWLARRAPGEMDLTLGLDFPSCLREYCWEDGPSDVWMGLGGSRGVSHSALHKFRGLGRSGSTSVSKTEGVSSILTGSTVRRNFWAWLLVRYVLLF
jgi:hypothetical protein